MEVGQVFGVGHGAGGVAEFHVGQFLGGLQREAFMAKAVGENDVAAFVGQVQRRFVAVVGFGDIALDDDLLVAQAQQFLGFIHAVDEVQVVGGILVMQQDHA